ncbi:MAG TPA: GTP-binding protein, partial [Acetobacteraceae bacterium]|nr:GTP-binding protein [Acetobacteraceae bacterium]
MAHAGGLLRVATCGSVDDGKSTLIGRLLHDTGSVPEDVLAALSRDSRKHGTTGEAPDLALLLDGLEAERQQGITIDVAHRYFSTARRSFILLDSPGHEQFTRNMATAASMADVAVVLVDARKGVLTQTRRHVAIGALLGVPRLVLAVNKMDLVGFDQAVFQAIVAELRAFAARLGVTAIEAVPICARDGDNVVRASARMPWHAGPPLLALLEEAPEAAASPAPFRFPVQWVSRPDGEFRGHSGTVASGSVAAGDEVVVAASGRAARVARIVTADGDLARAAAGEAVTLVL